MNKILDKVKSFFKSNLEIINPTAVLTVICIVVTLARSSANLLTQSKIEALTVKTQNEAMAKVLEGEYNEVTKTVNNNEITYHTVTKESRVIGYIFIINTNGYGGTVSVMTAVNSDGTVAAVQILDASNETPGLGQNVTKENFYTQFAGMTKNINVIKGGAANSENNEINAVTGATISSKAVTGAVNTALDYAAEIIAEAEEELNNSKGDLY